MTHGYTQSILQRAEELQRLETAAAALPLQTLPDLRAPFAALLAALLSLIPAVSAAQMII